MSLGYRFSLEQFEGPLDLLLTLIEGEKLDITTISLTKVTDQYLAYIEREENLPPEEIADFLVVAAKLIYLKSKYLLPSLELDGDDAGDLEHQLKIYREYYEANKVLARMIGKKRFSYMRTQPLKMVRSQGFAPPKHLTATHLAHAFQRVLGQLDVIAKLPKIILKKTVSIREKIQALRDALSQGIMYFHSIYDKSNKQDLIVSFLALLELVKMRDITVQQDRMFAEIAITKNHVHG